MAFELNENSGFLFPVEEKKNENYPDVKGTINVDGQLKEIALWFKEKNGKKFYGAKISEPYVNPGEEQKPEPQAAQEETGDLPF